MEKSHNSAVPSALWIILAPADCFCLRCHCFGSVSPVFIEKLHEAIVACAANDRQLKSLIFPSGREKRKTDKMRQDV